MKTPVALLILLLVGLWLAQPMSLSAQSGRRRIPKQEPQPTEPEKPPAEKPPEPAGEKPPEPIPPGGKITKREFDPQTATMRFQLANGLTVIVREKYSKPLVAMTAYIKAGHLDEPDEAPGVAELVQRVLLLGTSHRPKTQAARELRRLGGVLSACTWYEHTSYQVTLPAENALAALEIQADLLQHPLIEAEVVRRQAELLAQEYQAQRYDLAAQAFHSMLALAFPSHPLGRAPNPDRLRALTREHVLSFYHTHYRPEKVILAWVGAVSPFALMEPIQRAYGGWTVSDLKPQTANLRPQAQEVRELKREGEQPKVATRSPSSGGSDALPPASHIGQQAAGNEPQPTTDQLRYGKQEREIDPALLTVSYRLDGLEKADRIVLDVLATVLGKGRMSRLEQELRGTKPLVWEWTADQIELKDTALWWFQFWAAPEKSNQAEIAFFDLVQRLRRQVLSLGELRRAQSLLERWFYDRRAWLHQEADDLAHAEATAGDYHEADRYVERVRAVTAEQIQRAAAQYLRLSKVTVYEVVPRHLVSPGVTAESVAGWLATQVPGSDQDVAATQVKPAPPVPVFPQGQRERPEQETDAVLFSLQPEPVRDYSVLRGSRAYVRVDRARPTVSVGLLFHGGRLWEDDGNNGITELMLRAMLQGSVKSKWHPDTGAELERGEEMLVPAGTVALKLEQLGAEIELVNEPDFFGFILNVLSRNQEAALKLLVDIIERPAFDEAEFTRVRHLLLYELRQPRHQPIELAWRALLGQHPYGRPRLGNPAVIQNLTPAHVRAWRDRTIGHQFPLVIIVGDTDGSALISTVVAREIRRREAEPSVHVPALVRPESPREQAIADERMSALAVGFLGPPGQSPEHEVFEIIEQVLSGWGGRLTERLRDEQAIAYQVTSVYEPRLLAGAFFTALALARESEARALDVLEREFNRLTAEPFSEEEVAWSVNSAIGVRAVQMESHSARVRAYAQRVFLGGQPAEVESYGERIRRLTKEKIHAVASHYLKWNQRGVGVLK